MCNETAKFIVDQSIGTTYSSSVDGNRLQCKCGEGVFDETGNTCYNCDPKCLVCNHMLSVDCDMCANGAYKKYASECSTTCPSFYEKDETNHLCSFDMNLLNKPEKP